MKNRKISLKAKFFKPRSHDYRAVTIKTETNGGLLKTLIITSLIGVQLAFLIYLHVSFAFAFKWWVLVSFVLSVICCIIVLSSDKNGLSKAVWIIFLLLCFMFSVPIFILSDERIFFRRAKKKYNRIFERSRGYLSTYSAPMNVKENVLSDCKYLFRSGGFIPYNNSTVKYFPSGYLFFEEVLKELKKAEKFIFIEYYIVSDGALFNRIYDLLRKKVAEGVDVRLIYDDMGSHRGLTRKVKKQLKFAGIKYKPFNRLVPVFAVGLNYRDHRKIIVVDGKIAFTGGCNLADEYVNEKRMHGYWKDNGVKI